MEQVDTLLRDLAQQLGTTVEYLWPLYVKMIMIKAWESVGMAVILCLPCILALRYTAKQPTGPSDNVNPKFVGGVVLVIIFGFLFFIALCVVVGKFPALICPEAAALNEILKLL